MTIEIRPLESDEMLELGRMSAYVYAGAFGDDADGLVARSHLPQWTLCALEDGELLSSFVDLPLTIRANGRALPMAGVTVVGTFPEHRRRGLSRRLHTQAFANMHEAGRGVAGLWASQAAIYQRYGYAQATTLRSYEIDSVDIAFFDGDDGLGDVRRYAAETGFAAAKKIYIEFIAERTGYLHRSTAMWRNNALDIDAAPGPIHIAISHDDQGQPNGYLIYTLRANTVDHPARRQDIEIRDLAWLSQDAYRSLWSFIKRHDLVGRVRWATAPSDDPAPALFVEPRLLNPKDREGEWLRIVDVSAALAGRGYDTAGEVTIGLGEDSLAPWNQGTFKLHASPEGAEVTQVRTAPQVSMSIKTLALAFSGRYSIRQLLGWGLVEGDSKALNQLDALFATRFAPHCPDHY